MWILIAEPAEAGWMNNFGRLILSWLDKGCFVLLEFVYKVFFVVANATIFSPEFIRMFYARIQLILGVFMIFVVSFTLINYVVSPEKALDQRAGAGKFVMRIIVALFLLTLIIPINIPNVEEPAEGEAGSLNYYMNTHGILFGILYKFQDSVMRENFLGKLILGINTENSSDVTLDDLGGQISGTVARAFVRPNVIDTSEPYCEMTYDEALEQGVTDPCPNVICPTTVFTSSYDNLGLSGADIMDMVNLNCLPDNENPHWYENAGAWLMGIFGDSGKRYAFAYTPLLGAAASIIMTIIILGFTIDIAIRAIKLAVLRLIAPIPIIGYVQQPKDKGGGAFENWGRSLVSTYLDLFIRLAIIYFVLFVIRNFSTMTSFDNSTLVNSFATVFIILGMLFFAKQAPKFLKDMLGIKGNPMGNVGLSGILGGAAAMIGGAGLAGAAAAGFSAMGANAEAVGQGKPGPSAWGVGRDMAAQIKTGDPKAKGGIVNAMRDRLIRSSSQRVARKYGVTAAGLETAKKNSLAADAKAAEAKDLYERFVKGQTDVGDVALAELAARNNINYNARTGQFATEEDRVKMRQALYDYQNETATAAYKAKKTWDEGKEFAKTHRVNPTFEEEHRPSWREKLSPFSESQSRRPDMYIANRKGRNGYQNIADRIAGSHEDWKDSSTPRTDNRWDPNGTRTNIDNETMHDNPYGIPTPGEGPGPGRGPGHGPGPGHR